MKIFSNKIRRPKPKVKKKPASAKGLGNRSFTDSYVSQPKSKQKLFDKFNKKNLLAVHHYAPLGHAEGYISAYMCAHSY